MDRQYSLEYIRQAFRDGSDRVKEKILNECLRSMLDSSLVILERHLREERYASNSK